MPLIVEHTGTGGTESSGMIRPALRCSAALPACAVSFLVLASAGRADAADCALEPQGEGRVAAVVDGRSFRLEDGREIRLAGIELAGTDRAGGTSRLVRHRRRPRGDAAWRRRYAGPLWPPGRLCVRGRLANTRCKASCCAAARHWFRAIYLKKIALQHWPPPSARRAMPNWAFGLTATAIKNAESPGDILSAIGHFTVVEGRVLSVRQAGAITYLNFGRNWTRDFAATISRRIIPAFENASLGPKSLENRRIRVRGVVSSRGGPRIELLRVGQVEVLGGK